MRLNTILSLLLVLFVLAACGGERKSKTTEVSEKVNPQTLVDGNYQVAESTVKWTGKKLAGLDQHYGFIQLTEGSFTVAEGSITAGAKFVLDAQTIASEDLKDDPESAAKLNGHLKSADFFDAENYPSISFVASGVSNDSSGYQITGDLSIKDSTQTITIPAAIAQQGDSLNVAASFSFDRTKFGIVYSSTVLGTLADKAIDDEIEIELKLLALPAQTEAATTEAEPSK